VHSLKRFHARKKEVGRPKAEMTEKIYQQDAYCQAITARITDREFRNGLCYVRLDRTIFCPAGGGQPADQGLINGVPVRELAVEGEDVVHGLERDPGPEEASLQLDFQRRYDHMQQHTAQHLLSQVLLALWQAPTLSFAIGPEHASIEIGRPHVGDEELTALETECARAIFANRPIRVFSSTDPAALHLRKPPKRGGTIRVVEIEGLDRSACGGTHLRSSAEIGLLKVIKTDRVRSNVRLYFVAGFRALDDHQRKHGICQRLQRLVTQPLPEIPFMVESLLRERDALRRELKKTRERELDQEVARVVAAGEGLVVREFSGCDAAELRRFVNAVISHGRHVLAYSATTPRHVVVGRGRGAFDLRQVAAEVFALLQGKGGGTADLLTGQGEDFSKIPQIISLLQTRLDP
jgi:alanyl-tRNA synthetase